MDLIKILERIENIVSDDLSVEIDMDLANGELSGREKQMAQKLVTIYKIAHAHNPNHSCHYVHEDWRADKL